MTGILWVFAVGGFCGLGMAATKGVGPLLAISRIVDHARALAYTLPVLWHAVEDEHRRMYPAMLAKARRER